MDIADLLMQPNSPAAKDPNAILRAPEDIKRRRAMADKLILDASSTEPIKSPWQGAAKMANALLGAWDNYDLDKQERAGRASAASDFESVMPGSSPAAASAPQAGLAAQPAALPPFATITTSPPDAPQSPPMSAPGARPASGVDPATLRAITSIESGGNPNARSGKYAGLLQMGPDEVAKYGGNGVDQGAALLADRSANFARKYGRDPTPAELYMVHQQGEGGAAAHMANPDAPAWQNMAGTAEGRAKGAGWAKQAIWGNVPDDVKKQFPGGVDSLTSQQFMDLWKGKVDRRMGAGADAASGPLTANAPANAPVGRPPQQYDVTKLMRVLNNPYATPAQQQMASHLLQAQLAPHDYDLVKDANGAPIGSWDKKTGGFSKVDTGGLDFGHAKTELEKELDAAGIKDPAERSRRITAQLDKKADDNPASVKEYNYYKTTLPPGQPVMPYDQWSTAKSRAAATNVTTNVDMNAAQSYDHQLGEGLGKAHAALSNGVEDAQTRARDVAAMQAAVDSIAKNGGTTGGMGQPQILELKKTLNAGANAIGLDKPFNEGDLSDKEFLTKFNRQIAGAQAKGAVGSRVTNFELSNYLKANPGLDMSPTGNQRLLGIQAQIERRNIAVGNAIRQATAEAIGKGVKINPVTVQKIITDYDDQNHVMDPTTGQDLTQSYVLPEFQQAGQGTNPALAADHEKSIKKMRRYNPATGDIE